MRCRLGIRMRVTSISCTLSVLCIFLSKMLSETYLPCLVGASGSNSLSSAGNIAEAQQQPSGVTSAVRAYVIVETLSWKL